MEKKFEKATRFGIRFTTTKGDISVEDVWNLPLTSKGLSLDSLAKSLYRELKESEEESFVTKPTMKNSLIKLKFDIVKYIIDVKLREKEEKEAKIVNKEKIEKIERVLQQMEDKELLENSKEDLLKMKQELLGK